MRRDKNVPDSGEYHPKRWSRQWKTVNLERKERKDENKEKEQTVRENHEWKKTNSREQKWRRMREKRKRARERGRKNTKPDRETGGRNGGGWFTKVNKKEKRNAKSVSGELRMLDS